MRRAGEKRFNVNVWSQLRTNRQSDNFSSLCIVRGQPVNTNTSFGSICLVSFKANSNIWPHFPISTSLQGLICRICDVGSHMAGNKNNERAFQAVSRLRSSRQDAYYSFYDSSDVSDQENFQPTQCSRRPLSDVSILLIEEVARASFCETQSELKNIFLSAGCSAKPSYVTSHVKI